MNVVDSFYDLVERGRSGENSSLPIGLPKLEGYIEGLSQGSHILIGAGSGVGKTTLLLYSFIYKPIMAQDPEKDVHFLMFNLEMGEEQILAKLLSIYIYEHYGVEISFKEIFSRGRDTILSDENYYLIKECRPILEMFQERITFVPGPLNAETFDKAVMDYLKNYGTFNGNTYTPNNPKQILGVVVDHLSLVRASNGRSKKEEMDLISNHGVSFRNKCRILTLIFLMQLNRNQYGNERLKNESLREPDESDLKDSGTMMEDCHIALLMFSPVKAKLGTHRGYDISELGGNYRSVKCVKNRFGTADIAVGLGFYGNIGIFKELPKASEITDYEKYKRPDWCLIDESLEVKESDNVNLTIVL